MKSLILLRHAKSSWDHTDLSDHDRPLNARGLKDAPIIGEYLYKANIIPDIILCSTAVRTKKTYELVLKNINPEIPVLFNKEIYDGSANEIINLILKIESDINKLMIIGHNPDMEDIFHLLTTDELPYEKFATCSAAVIDFNINKWEKIKLSKGKLKLFITPKLL